MPTEDFILMRQMSYQPATAVAVCDGGDTNKWLN